MGGGGKAAPVSVRGRERVFGLVSTVAEISAAFGPGPAARIAAGEGDDCLAGGEAFSRAARSVVTLMRAMAARIGVREWWIAFGDTPDALTPMATARKRIPGLDAAFSEAGIDEAAALLAFLAGPPDKGGHRLVSAALRALIGGRPPSALRAHLSLATDAGGAEAHILAFRRHGGPDASFWLADDSLGVRFSFRRSEVEFRAHHPVIQEALEDRCREEGIDLL